MGQIIKLEDIDRHRRRFFGAAAVTIAAASFVSAGGANARQVHPDRAPSASPQRSTGFAPLKRIAAGVLTIAYAEAAPADGPVVILLHGWPYDIQSFVDVTPLLVSRGYRVLAPYLRGYGTTSTEAERAKPAIKRHLSAATMAARGEPPARLEAFTTTRPWCWLNTFRPAN
jgi:hypothetical protein